MELTTEERALLTQVYKQVKPTLEKSHNDQSWQRDTNSDILIVDGYNTFMRCWSAIPSMNDNGDHMGGIVGFFKSVGAAIKMFHPTRCVIAFDGVGGSFKRRKIFPEYKERRKNKIRLNRVYEDQSTWSEEEKNCLLQLAKLDHYLQLLPVNILRLDHVEADDTIAYCAVDTFKKSRIIIMSSDKDFLQLVDDRIKVWSPTKKIFYGPAEILRDYGIHPNNFVLFRAMDGDDSDNIGGINGAGIKTVLKCFPFLAESKIFTLDDIINHAMANKKKYKIYDKVIEGREILKRNISLMQLKDSLLTTTAQLMVNGLLETPKIPRMNRTAFVRRIVEDGMVNNFPDHQSWLTEVFAPLDSVTRSE
jgi:5'-3' exonuclease